MTGVALNETVRLPGWGSRAPGRDEKSSGVGEQRTYTCNYTAYSRVVNGTGVEKPRPK